jgi:glycosyltransferase involved in cell wall biosynthesis
VKISIITVTYNSAQTVEETIVSVINQSYSDIEYIIIDGLSDDNTMAIIEKYRKKINKIISEKDAGLYDALNKGIALATGDVIGILHSDDFYTNNDVIQNYVNVFQQTTCDAVYSDLYYVDRSQTDKIIRKWKSGDYSPGAFVNGWMPPHPTFFVKKEVYNKFGIFNTSFHTAADYELMLRFVHKNKISIAYLPQYTIKMRVGGASNVSFKSRIKANLEDRRAWRINDLKPRFYTLYLKPLRKIFQFISSK